MTIFLTVLHVMVCLVLVIVVLLQHGKGADVGAVFGGGASNTVFGSRGAGNFLTRLTTGAALLFMVSSLSLSYIANTGLTGGLFEEDAPPPGVLTPAPAEGAGEASEGAAPGGFEEVAPPTAGAPSAEAIPEAADASPPAEQDAADTPEASAADPNEPSAAATDSPAPTNP